MKSEYDVYCVGKVSSMAQVEALGYILTGEKLSVGSWENPRAGITSAPVKKLRIFGNVTVPAREGITCIITHIFSMDNHPPPKLHDIVYKRQLL